MNRGKAVNAVKSVALPYAAELGINGSNPDIQKYIERRSSGLIFLFLTFLIRRGIPRLGINQAFHSSLFQYTKILRKEKQIFE